MGPSSWHDGRVFAAFMNPDDTGVGVAFTDRLGGVSQPPFDSLNLGRSGFDDDDALTTNFGLLRSRLGVGTIVTVAQVHGTDVLEVTSDLVTAGGPLVKADAMVTTLTGVALCIRVADCLPVLFSDPVTGVVGAAHAGRVGLLAGVLPATVAAMRRLGARHIEAWIGPGICGRCYEVPQAMAEDAWHRLPATKCQTTWGTPSIDLAAGAVQELQEAEVTVTPPGQCTFETPSLYSHRRDHGATGRQAGVIWRLRP